MSLIEIDGCDDCKTDGQEIESGSRDPERRLLELVGIFCAVISDPPHHVPDPDARDHFNEGVHSKSEERHTAVFEAEEYRNNPFNDVVGDGNDR